MRKVLLALAALAAVAPTTQAAGPIRTAIREWREARAAKRATCQPAQQPALSLPLLSRPVSPAVAASPPVQSLRGLFGAPGGCPGGTCPR